MPNDLYGNFLLFRSFFSGLKIIRTLPNEIRDPDLMTATLKPGVTHVVNTPESVVDKLNQELDELKDEMKSFGKPRAFNLTQVLFFSVRILTVLASVYGDIFLTVVVSLLQFLVIPYSFFVAFANFMALAPPLFICHYISFILLKIASAGLPVSLQLTLPVTPMFIALFFAIDQAMCFYLMFTDTHLGKPAVYPFSKAIKHILYGFINTKSYTLIILLHLYHAGFEIPLIPFAVDGCFRITPFFSRLLSRTFMHWAALFYQQHRMAHIPVVYEHAHKMHHFLYDSTAFDAHLYGSGAPEEWFELMLELLGAVYGGLLPTSLGWNALYLSWTNKVGHTRKQEHLNGCNDHVDHHTYHSKNFGIYGLTMDTLFGTEAKSGNPIHVGQHHVLTRSVANGVVTLTFAPKVPYSGSDDKNKTK